MAAARSLVSGFFSLFTLIFLHVGCFFLPSSSTDPNTNTNVQPAPKRRKISPVVSSHSHHHQQQQPPPPSSPPKSHQYSSSTLASSIKSYLSNLFSCSSPFRRRQPCPQPPSPASTFPPSPQQQQQQQQQQQPQASSFFLPTDRASDAPKAIPTITAAAAAAAAAVKRSSFASRADIFPCTACGEVFSKTHLLDLHQATKHSLSELSDGDSGKNIVRIIFQSGWRGRSRGDDKIPAVHRILKIHNSPKTLARFEEYRESVRSRAARSSSGGRRGGGSGVDERCVADGNERLRFYCATFLCGLGREGNLGTCGSQFCCTCAIVRQGFSGKDADGIATHATGRGAHVALPEELEREFAFMHVRRAMLVCRVVAGRVAVGKCSGSGEVEEDGSYDSVSAAVNGGGGARPGEEEEELLVFNPRAVLPCFVIIYTA